MNRPSGYSMNEASIGWSTRITMYPRLARSSAAAVYNSLETPYPGENTRTGNSIEASGALICACVVTVIGKSGGRPASAAT